MNLQFYRDVLSRHGVASTLYYGLYRGMNHVTKATLWNAIAITLERLDEKILAEPAAARVEDKTADELRPYIEKENTLTDDFLDAAAERGDRCFAVFDGERLANYGWYSSTETPLLELGRDVTLRFDSHYSYMHNGYTHPDYRGQRLHAISMAVALKTLTEEGQRGLVSYVATSNFASLKSCYRMGYEVFGRFAAVKLGDGLHWFLTPGCRKYGFDIATGDDKPRAMPAYRRVLKTLT